jgi:hypothetical protein
MSRVIPISAAEGLKKNTTSSAYNDTRCCKALLASGLDQILHGGFCHHVIQHIHY